MSLHAQLTSEAARRLASQKRNSTISSFIIAILLTALIVIIMFIISMALPDKELPEITFIPGISEENPPPERPKLSTTSLRKPTPPSSDRSSRVIATNAPSLVTITNPVFETDSTSVGIGDDDFGEGIGTGFEPGGDTNIPTGTLRKRCSKADRLARLEATGGTAACDEAVLKSLRWLQQRQNKNGSWDNQYQVAMTGLALLAYLGHCETPASEEFGETVFDATVFLVNNGMKNNGKLSSDFKDHWCYEHAIATYALCECYSFSKTFNYEIPNLQEVTQEAVQWILNNPNEVGGWNYTYNEKPRWDTSINAWHLQALKAAKTSGLELKNMKRVTRAALNNIIDTQQSHGGFGYNKQGPIAATNGHFTLTGAGTLCVQQHKGVHHRNAQKGIRYITNNMRFDFKEHANLYEHYYVSQAMINHGREAWKQYNEMVRDQLLTNQSKDGSWPNPKGNPHFSSQVYNTCLATLMLEVYYRYLPGTGNANQ